jgi:hypothetical protein
MADAAVLAWENKCIIHRLFLFFSAFMGVRPLAPPFEGASSRHGPEDGVVPTYRRSVFVVLGFCVADLVKLRLEKKEEKALIRAHSEEMYFERYLNSP